MEWRAHTTHICHIEAFLVEVEEDLEMNDLPLLENTLLLLVLAPVFPGFIPFVSSL